VILPDTNVLIYAFRRDAHRHEEYRGWLEHALANESAFGISDVVLSAIVRITTHPRIFVKPSTLKQALEFCSVMLDQPNTVRVTPGPRHWSIFTNLCRKVDVKGNLVPDAYLAALAIEAGAEWITTDHDFARFSGLRWRHPLATE
jgi:hypothetical protein